MATYLTLVDPARNHNKHYFVAIVPNGQTWELWTAWGRIGNTPQEKLAGSFSSAHAATAEEQRVVQERLGKGYIVVQAIPSNAVTVKPRWFQVPGVVGPPAPNWGNHGVKQNEKRFEADLMSAIRAPIPTKPLVEEKPKKQDIFTERKNAAKWNF